MIILRQKLYTRAEKAMWEELYKATNGFKNLPAKYKNMTPRDVYRLRNIMRAGYSGKINPEDADFVIQKVKNLNRGKIPKNIEEKLRNTTSEAVLNPEDIEIVANHLGLSETAKTGARVFNKYNNPELIERFNRIKKLEAEEYNNLMYKWHMEGLTEQEATRLDTLIEKFQGEVQRKRALEEFSKEQQNLSQKYSSEYRKPHENNPKLSEKVKDYLENKKLMRVIEDSSAERGSHGDVGSRSLFIHERDKYSPGAILHEGGHVEACDRSKKELGELAVIKEGGLDRSRGDFLNPMYPLADEYEASARALSRMKAGLATPKEIAEAEADLTGSYKSYYHNALDKVRQKTLKRLYPYQ